MRTNWLQGILASVAGVYLNVASGASIVVVNTLCFVVTLLITNRRAQVVARPAEVGADSAN